MVVIGNATLLKERVLSIPDHLCNVHQFPENQEHMACSHDHLEEKAWLSPDSKVGCITCVNYLFSIVITSGNLKSSKCSQRIQRSSTRRPGHDA